MNNIDSALFLCLPLTTYSQNTMSYSANKPLLPKETVLVTGVVKDDSDQPLEYAVVDINLAMPPVVYKRVVSDVRGKFEVKLPITHNTE